MEKNLKEELDDFLREEHYDRIIELARKGGESLVIDYEKLSRFDPDIAHKILEKPKKVIKIFKKRVKKIDFLQKELDLNIRINNLPEDRQVAIRHIRSKHINKLIAVRGIIRQTSDVRPEAASVVFKCPSCGRLIEVKQKKKKMTRPSRCKCGRKGKFKMKEKKLIDTQRLVLEESPETLEGGEQPKRIPVYIKDDLVSPEMERRVCPGSRVRVYGIIEEVPLTTQRGAKSNRYELKMTGNYIEPIEQAFKELEIEEKDKREIESIANAPDTYERLIDSIAPTITGYRVIKESILLQLFSGVRKVKSDGTVSRGDIHVLLVGDPGTGKCVSPQTNIALSDGRIKKVKDIIDPELEGKGKKVKKKKLISTDYSLNISKEDSIAVSKRYYTGKLYEIVTSSGREIKVTKKHPLFAFNGGNIKKKPAESIEKGDSLAIVKKLPIKGEKQDLPEFRLSSREKDIKLPNKTNPDFLEFIGYYLSEGIIDKNEIRMTNFSSTIQKRLKRLGKKVFGIKAKKESSGDLRFFSSALCRFFKRIGLKTGAGNKEVPEKLMKCKNEGVAKLLRGIFDGDGSVSKKDRNITLSSKSKELVEDVQHLLLRFGIFSSIHPTWKKAQGWEKKKKYYRLRISNYKNLKRFKENIGFIHRKKKERLKKHLTKERMKHYEGYRENKFPVGEKLLKIRRLVNFPVPRGSKTYSKQRFVKITNKGRILEYLNEFEKRANKILEANLPKEPKKFWNSIGKIKKLTNEPFSSFCSSAAKHYIDLKPKKRINLIKKARAYNKLKVGETTKSQVAGLTSQTTALRWKKGICKPSVNILKETEKTRKKLKKCLEKAKMKARQAKAEIERLRHIINLNIAWDVVEKVKEKEVSKFPVYDFQMMGAPTFMANGFVSHNSSLLKYVSKLAPKASYVTGKGTSLDYKEPVIIKEDGETKITKIGEFVDKFHKEGEKEKKVVIPDSNSKVPCMNESYKIKWKPIEYVYRHPSPDNLLKLRLETGRKVTVTGAHSVFAFKNGKPIPIEASKLEEGDYLLIPEKIPSVAYRDLPPQLARTLGYWVADGWTDSDEDNYSYRVGFSLNGEKDKDIINDLNQFSNERFDYSPKIYSKSGKGVDLTLRRKGQYEFFKKFLGNVSEQHAKEKKVPRVILNSSKRTKEEFLKGWVLGDGGVTKSEELMSDILYLFSQVGTIASCYKRNGKRDLMIEGRKIRAEGPAYTLKSPKSYREKDFGSDRYINRYGFPPISEFNQDFMKKTLKKDYEKGYRNVRPRLLREVFLKKYKRLRHLKNWKAYEELAEELNISKVAAANYLREEKSKGLVKSKKIKARSIEIVDRGKKGKIKESSHSPRTKHKLTEKGTRLMKKIKNLKKILESDLGFVKIKEIEKVEPSGKYVYDISVEDNENFVGGSGGVICHNTTAGLTASVVRSEIGEGWNLEAGALVLSSGGICCIDEIDKMSPKDKVGMNEALSEQTVTIAKANIRATLKAQTTVLGAANPELGRFDPYTPLAEQIDIPPTLINRFDLIFPIRDIPKKERDQRIASHILKMHKEPKKELTKVDPELFRKYVAHAKDARPELTEEAIERMKNFYVELRNQKTVSSSEEDIKPIPISARQLQALIRLSEASARVRLDDWVREGDAKRAIRLLKYSLGKVGVSPETGEIDIDRVMTGISTSQRSRIMRIRDVIKSLEKKVGDQIPISEVLDRAEDIGINRDKCEEVLDKMEREGEIFEPRRGVIKRVKS